MKGIPRASVGALCLAALVFAGCRKQEQTAGTSGPTPGATAPAQPGAGTSGSAAAGGAQAAKPDDTAAKMAAIDWAMKQEQIKTDSNGQWASEASASSSYNDAQGSAAWSAQHATGPPDVDQYGDNGNAWAPKTQDSGIEWLDLKYAKPVYATEIRVRESCGSGAVIKIEAFDEMGAAHTVWQGLDPTKDLNYLIAKFTKTGYKVNRVKVTLATNLFSGWKEIDAVQLVGTDAP